MSTYFFPDRCSAILIPSRNAFCVPDVLRDAKPGMVEDRRLLAFLLFVVAFFLLRSGKAVVALLSSKKGRGSSMSNDDE